MENCRIDIAACTDRRFVMTTDVMMYSVCVNNPDVDIVFHVIHDDSPQKLQTYFKQIGL